MDMKEIEINVKIDQPFGNLLRKETVLVAGTTDDYKIIVSGKSVYPNGIFRLPGGGVELGETKLQAAKRETMEEMGKIYKSSNFKPIIDALVEATDRDKKKYHHLIRVYYLYVNSDKLQAGDDSEILVKMSTTALLRLSRKYQRLPSTLVAKQGETGFLWKDYGKVYGPIHEETAKLLKKYLK